MSQIKSMSSSSLCERIELNPAMLQYVTRRLSTQSAGRVTRTTTQEASYTEIISSYGVTWLVDDAAVDGAILIFNPRSGQLFLKFIDTTKPPAEEVAMLVHSLPSGEEPKQIIVSKRMLIGPLVDNCPNTVIKASQVQLPFRALLKMEKLSELFTTDQPHHVVFAFKMYDDWLRLISSYSSFSRLALVLRALDVNYEEAKRLLEMAKTTTHELVHHIWPSLSYLEWKKVELALRNLILSDYTHKNKVVDASDFTKSKICDIIFAGASTEIAAR